MYLLWAKVSRVEISRRPTFVRCRNGHHVPWKGKNHFWNELSCRSVRFCPSCVHNNSRYKHRHLWKTARLDMTWKALFHKLHCNITSRRAAKIKMKHFILTMTIGYGFFTSTINYILPVTFLFCSQKLQRQTKRNCADYLAKDSLHTQMRNNHMWLTTLCRVVSFFFFLDTKLSFCSWRRCRVLCCTIGDYRGGIL